MPAKRGVVTAISETVSFSRLASVWPSGLDSFVTVGARTGVPGANVGESALTPDGSVVPDLRRKLPGRGVWVTATRVALTEAVRRKAFARGLKAVVKTAPDLPALVRLEF